MRRLTVVEGTREIHRALYSGVIPVEAFICGEYVETTDARECVNQLEKLESSHQCRLYAVPPELYRKIAYRGESEGLLMVIPYLTRQLDDIRLGAVPFLLAVENVEKPGNLGAILRTADAAGVDCVLVAYSDGHVSTDIHNPNLIRASLGTIFSVPVIQASSSHTIAWLREKGIHIITSSPRNDTVYFSADCTGPVAVALGSEAHGLTSSWFNAADEQVFIPMGGVADSLNLSASAAILLYEVVRQRTQPAHNS